MVCIILSFTTGFLRPFGAFLAGFLEASTPSSFPSKSSRPNKVTSLEDGPCKGIPILPRGKVWSTWISRVLHVNKWADFMDHVLKFECSTLETK